MLDSELNLKYVNRQYEQLIKSSAAMAWEWKPIVDMYERAGINSMGKQW